MHCKALLLVSAIAALCCCWRLVLGSLDLATLMGTLNLQLQLRLSWSGYSDGHTLNPQLIPLSGVLSLMLRSVFWSLALKGLVLPLNDPASSPLRVNTSRCNAFRIL